MKKERQLVGAVKHHSGCLAQEDGKIQFDLTIGLERGTENLLCLYFMDPLCFNFAQLTHKRGFRQIWGILSKLSTVLNQLS